MVEGIGLNRLTKNFSEALPLIDDAFRYATPLYRSLNKRSSFLLCRVTDAEAVAMSRHLAKEDGLFLGSSSAVNLVACVRLAKKLGPGARIVTILWCATSSPRVMRWLTLASLSATLVPGITAASGKRPLTLTW